ncbi:MAG TPA: Tox-REase-5 domain-containing protein, partial [Myxococcaceae bacterium]|nr:Tox-REase-5 domain-containing protein [Myxococcaceae bacterium]
PVLSLTARGELVLGEALVVEGTAATALAVDLGALSILHMASRGQGKPAGGASSPSGQPSKTTAVHGPGKWTYKTSTTGSKRAQEYQEQITGRPAWYVYMVGTVEFDGFNGKQLLEAKGRGYKNFIRKDGRLQPWYEAGKGFKGLMEQADRQSKLADTLNVPVVWHVAEVEFANFLRKLFKKEGWTNIEVRHTPPVQ